MSTIKIRLGRNQVVRPLRFVGLGIACNLVFATKRDTWPHLFSKLFDIPIRSGPASECR
jgi:hypothetical protein